MNAALFARIDALYEKREALGLDAETLRVLEQTWKNFVRAGAKLDDLSQLRACHPFPKTLDEAPAIGVVAGPPAVPEHDGIDGADLRG